jgi:ABC-type antimicrobial peptide transport system ATPase subunit
MQFRLLNDHVLKIEPEKFRPSRVRLIVKHMGTELVCRKEGINQLLEFLYSNNEHLFKGRLQISKNNDQIKILVKEENVGSIDAKTLKDGLISVLNNIEPKG